jgi:uncharacterized protein YndB with AHSA1/START domain
VTGLTKDAGWQLGVRRTVAAPLEEVWDHLVSAEGLRPVLTAGGTVTEARSRTERKRVRVRWREDGADHVTTLQLTLLTAVSGTTIALHQDQLTGPQERERLLTHWTRLLERIVADLSPVNDA